LQYQLANYDYDGKPVPVINPATGQAGVGTIHDPVEIYKKLKECKENEIEAQRKKATGFRK
jgi:hypothetical protein